MTNFNLDAKAGMPLQAIPVERHICGSAVSGEGGVEASAWWNTLARIAKTALPIAAQVAGML